ncbi:MAG: hypothetical protein JSV24_05470 [Bacteroidales bacterium]|nr:MAG: hypothetical protein JSV24_05470 [Bacteroidales bacterium]
MDFLKTAEFSLLKSPVRQWQTVCWESPANIALVKYWGKYDNQIPRNPSISFTLGKSKTWMKTDYKSREKDEPNWISLKFEGNENPEFENRIKLYLEKVTKYLPFLSQIKIRIESNNTFPHSSGIASSASSMSALALCLCTIEDMLFGSLNDPSIFFRKASFFARLASGSACRSLYGGLVSWGKSDHIPGSRDEFAQPFSANLHPVFKSFRDAVLIVSSGKKKVSSTKGHAMMNDHPYSETRYLQAEKNLEQLLTFLRSGNLSGFTGVVENEAMSIHGMMMTSSPGYILLEPNTIEIIEKIRRYRKQTGRQVCFTLDAGPNIHLLYPDRVREELKDFIITELLPFCENNNWIDDEVGPGPKKII